MVSKKEKLSIRQQCVLLGLCRALDDIYIERLWRSVKQEYVYKNPCDTCKELWDGMKEYFDFYNNRRLHQSLEYKCPATVYTEKRVA